MKKIITVLFVGTLLVAGCQKKEIVDINNVPENSDSTQYDPYKIENKDLYNEGDTIHLATNFNLHNDSAGYEGDGQIWDFSSLVVDAEQEIYFVSPSVYTYGVDYPTANLAYEQEGDITVFLNKSVERLEVVGLYGDLTGEGIIVGVNYEPSQLLYNFPFTKNDSYNDSASFSKAMSISEVPDLAALSFIADSFQIKQKNILKTEVNASGTIITPVDTFECIREYREEIITDSIFAHFTAGGWDIVPYIPGYFEYENPVTYTTKKYVWYVKGLGYPVAEAILDSTGVVSQINYLNEK